MIATEFILDIDIFVFGGAFGGGMACVPPPGSAPVVIVAFNGIVLNNTMCVNTPV